MESQCETASGKARLLLEEYRGKFPEIPENELQKIVEKYASHPDSCQKMLEIESKKCLYGSSPTSDPPSPIKPLAGPQKKTDGANLFDLPRCNSTGSAGSSHSSGRSTPVNPIPTPWMVPRYPAPTTAGHGATPVHFPTSVLPPGTVCINGSYYQPVTNIPGHPSMAPSQVSPTNNPLGSTPPVSVAPNNANQTSPNTVYPVYSTNGYFPVSTGQTPPISLPVSTVSSQTMAQGAIPTQYFSPTKQPLGYPYYPQGENMPYSVAGQFDPRYHTLPGTVALSTLTTPNLPTSTGFMPISSTTPSNRSIQEPATLNPDERRLSDVSPNRLPSSLPQLDPRFQTMPVGSSGMPIMDPLFVSTAPFSAGMNSPETIRKLKKQSASFDEMRVASFGMMNRQPVANDDYLRACLSHQHKRFQKLQKEYAIEKERLNIVINDISERDGSLYDVKYVVEPNPTDEQIQRLSEENERLKRTIDEISKNIDRVDNGQGFLPPVDGRIHDTQRLPSSNSRQRDTTLDRSISVPCLHDRDPAGRVPPLSRPLSEVDMNHMLNFDRDRVQYQVKPPQGADLQDWNFINPSLPDPIPPTNINNGDDETQWSCSRCTFLNHDSLTVCEMCSSSRHQ